MPDPAFGAGLQCQGSAGLWQGGVLAGEVEDTAQARTALHCPVLSIVGSLEAGRAGGEKVSRLEKRGEMYNCPLGVWESGDPAQV